jgi:hypothetical protein
MRSSRRNTRSKWRALGAPFSPHSSAFLAYACLFGFLLCDCAVLSQPNQHARLSFACPRSFLSFSLAFFVFAVLLNFVSVARVVHDAIAATISSREKYF